MISRGTLFANAVCLAAALLSAIMLTYVAVNWERLLTTPSRTAFFLGAPVLGILVGLAALKLAPVRRIQFAGVLFSVGFAVYAAEIFLIFFPIDTTKTRPDDVPFDTRTRYEVVRDYRAEGKTAYPGVFPAYLLRTQLDGSLASPLSLNGKEVLPLGGVAGVLTVLCNESGEFVFYRADERGFNNPPGLWDKGERTLAVLGDSFAQGYCVHRRDSFAGRIRSRHPAALNLAMSGNGPLLMLATLKEYLPAIRPKTVLWFFFEGNDLTGDLAIQSRSPLLRRYLETPDFNQGLARHHATINASLAAHLDGLLAASARREGTDAGRLQAILSTIGLANLRRVLRLPSTKGGPNFSLFRRILESARDTVRGWNGRLFLVYLPTFKSVARGDNPPAITREIHATVRRATGELEIPFIDVRKRFLTLDNPKTLFRFQMNNHYNEAGHALVARTVLDALAAPGMAGE